MERRRFIGGVAGLALGGSSAPGSDSTQASTDSVNVRDYGARGDAKSDDADAIVAAIAAAQGAVVRFPAGRYLLGRDLVVTDTVNLVGTPEVSVLLPTKDGGVGLSISTPANGLGTSKAASVYGLTIDGSHTRAATGMIVGATGVTGRVRLSHLEIRAFHGARAVGLRVRDCVDTSFEYSYFGRNTVNVLIEGNSRDLPTLTRFHVCAFREADTAGIQLRRGYMTSFAQCLIEANKQEGVKIGVTPGSTVLRTSFDQCWFEDNHHRAQDQADRFHVVCDGTDGTAEIRIANAYMSGLSRAIWLRNTVNFILDDVLVQPVANTIVTEGTNCSGVMTNMPLNVALRLDRIWKNTAEHDAIVVVGTRGVPPSANRMVLEGWRLAATETSDGLGVLQDHLGVAGRAMVRPGHVTRILVTVLASSAANPAVVEVQRSADAGRTWTAIRGASLAFVTTPGSHLVDVIPDAGQYGEGDLLRLVLRGTSEMAPTTNGSAAIEVEVDSWKTAVPPRTSRDD